MANNIKLTISGISLKKKKIFKHAKYKNRIYYKEEKKKNQSKEAEQEMTEMMELSGKDVKTDHVNMPHMFQKIEENRSMVRRELEHIETSQIGYPEMKNIVSEMKNTLNGINCRLKYTEESVSDLESMAIKYQK